LEELLYHVNEKDEVLGKISRNEAHSKGILHRAGMVFLINSGDKILINKRSSKHEIHPFCYDPSVSFHVIYGETYEDSAKRETEEEIKIKAPLKLIGKFLHRNPPQIVSVFLSISDNKPVIDSKEFSGGGFYSINKAEQIIQNEKITPWLREGWKILIKYLNTKKISNLSLSNSNH
jgi:isopentenyl-diphosphate delta-isomerase